MGAIARYRNRRKNRLEMRLDSAKTTDEQVKLVSAIYNQYYRKDADDDIDWITMNGTHVPIQNGEMTGGPLAGQAHTPKFGGANSKTFSKAVADAKANVAKTQPEIAWRVTAHTQAELDKEYPGAKMHITQGGSTAAVTTDGDIISVCKNPGDTMSGKEILKLAVDNGGTKLDSYSGNHGFYTKCGFEPVSWCKWEDKYAPSDWDESKGCKREPVIFYKYTGNTNQSQSADDFMKKVPASKDYDAAKAVRDNSIGGKTK